MNSRPRLYTFLKIWTPDWDQQNIKYIFWFAATWPKQHYHKTTLYDFGCQRGGFVARRMILIKNIWHNIIHRFWVCMVVANCHGGVACVLCVTNAEPLHFESSPGSAGHWLNTHKADRRWPIIILLIGRDCQSLGQKALAERCSGFCPSDIDDAVHTGFCEKELWWITCLVRQYHHCV